MKKPFMIITIPMILGIIFSYYFKINSSFLFIGVLSSFLIFSFSIIFGSFKKRYLMILFFFIGILTTHIKFESSVLSKFIGKSIKLEGTINETIYNEKDISKYILNVEKIVDSGISYFPNEKLSLKVIGQDKFEIGDKVLLSGELKKPNKNTNPKLFNYRLYLQIRGIHTNTTVKKHEINKIDEKTLSWYENMKINFTKHVELCCDTYLEEQNSSIIKAILLGQSSYLEEQEYNKFKDLGLTHIMAVSGLHIGIISLFLITFLAYLGVERKTNTILTLVIIWTYGFLIGYPPSVLRALIMFTLLFYSKVIFRRYDSINTLFFAMFIILSINPLWLFDIGFQLSFGATFFITFLTPILRKKFYPYNKKLESTLYSILSVQIGLAPILFYYFNSISIISILGNFILIPILSKSVVLGFLLLLFSYFSSGISSLIGKILNILLNINYLISEGIYGLPLGKIRFYSPNIIEILLYYFSIFSLFKVIKLNIFNEFTNKAIIFYLVICILFTCITPFIANRMYIHFIDVGQGDCILIEDGNRFYLVDTGGSIFGNFDIGENILLPYLIKRGIFTLDGVFITHFHDDHCKSLWTLMKNMDIKKVFIGYENKDNKLYTNIVNISKEESIPIYKLSKGDKVFINKNSYVEVLSPLEEFMSKNRENENNLSMVLLLKSFGRKTLLTGDIEEAAETHLLENMSGREGKVDFLKVPHHGSNTSSGENFIDFFNPDYAFIQVGKNNSFNHPNEEVLERYERRNIKILRTDESGLITLRIMPKRFDISIYNKERLSIDDLVLDYGLEINFTILYLVLSYIIIKRNSYLFEELDIHEV